MSWDQLELELSEMFDEYTWRTDDAEQAIADWAHAKWAAKRVYDAEYHRGTKWVAYMKEYNQRAERKRKAVERTRLWKLRNPERTRAHAREGARRRKEARAA